MTPDILITNALLLREPGAGEEIELGFVAVRDGRIEGLGPMTELGDRPAATTIDAGGGLLMPGLVNTHCHAAMTLFRGLADDQELAVWLNDHIFPAEAAHVNPEMVYWCSKLAAAEMILAGTTLVADGYFFAGQAARAFSETGLRAVAAQGVIDFPAPGVPEPAENIRAAARFIDERQERHPLITPAVFAHSPYTCSPETLQKAKALARSRNVPFFVHVAETGQEQGRIAGARGDSPVRHLEALGILDEQTVCVHCVWVDEEDLDILARRNARVSICPQSHLKLASGMAPLAAMLERSITVGLGTDGAASNNGLDLFREMDICAKVQKIKTMDPVAVRAGDVLRLVTRDGAAVLGFAERLGALRAGSLADLVLVDLDRPHLQPFYGPDLLVYAAGGADVRSVIINGKLVMHNRQLLTIDLDETMARVRDLARSVG
ncbi:MAG: amidohydrolase family protein [Proteobacteria bacterium]|nr:amidohydrolase family protein [Pseudomonadota bacterium]